MATTDNDNDTEQNVSMNPVNLGGRQYLQKSSIGSKCYAGEPNILKFYASRPSREKT